MSNKETKLNPYFPSEGMRLTNGDVIAEREIYLGINDSKSNWYEITEEEAQRILAEREAKTKKEVI